MIPYISCVAAIYLLQQWRFISPPSYTKKVTKNNPLENAVSFLPLLITTHGKGFLPPLSAVLQPLPFVFRINSWERDVATKRLE